VYGSLRFCVSDLRIWKHVEGSDFSGRKAVVLSIVPTRESADKTGALLAFFFLAGFFLLVFFFALPVVFFRPEGGRVCLLGVGAHRTAQSSVCVACTSSTWDERGACRHSRTPVCIRASTHTTLPLHYL